MLYPSVIGTWALPYQASCDSALASIASAPTVTVLCGYDSARHASAPVLY